MLPYYIRNIYIIYSSKSSKREDLNQRTTQAKAQVPSTDPPVSKTAGQVLSNCLYE